MGTLRKGVPIAVCAIVMMLAGTACGNQDFGCPQVVPIPQPVQLLYPLPNTTDVAPNIVSVLYASSSVVPISLSSGSESITAQPAIVPSPLPSPIAAPEPGIHTFAAGVNPLASGTTYTVIATAPEYVCGQNGPKGVPETIGSFTTR